MLRVVIQRCPWALLVGMEILGGCHFGYPYHHDGTTYTMSSDQADYHKKVTRQMVARRDKLRASGASDAEVFRELCAAYDAPILDAPDEWADNFTPAKKLLEQDRNAVCAQVEAEEKAQKQREAEERRRAAREKVEAANQERQAARRREIAEHLATEVKTGTCHSENEALYQAFLTQQVPIIARAMERPAVSDIGPHKIIVATDKPETYSFQAELGGLYHVFAVGIETVQLDEVRDGNGDRATAPSPYSMGGFSGGFPMQAVMARARPRQEVSVTVRGRGCTLIFTINQMGE